MYTFTPPIKDLKATERSLFRELQLKTEVNAKLQITEAASKLGWTKPKPFQEAAVYASIMGWDTKVIVPTAGGKSGCFQILAIIGRQLLGNTGILIIIQPLNSLMHEQVKKLTSNHHKAVVLDASTNWKTVSVQIQSGHYNFLFTSPEVALGNNMKKLWRDRQFTKRLFGVVIDEAHCIVDYGESNFRPEYSEIGRLRAFVRVPFMVLSATLPASYEAKIDELLSLQRHKTFTVRDSVDKTNVYYVLQEASNIPKILSFIVKAFHSSSGGLPGGGKVLIYTRTKTQLLEVFNFLMDNLDENGRKKLICLHGDSDTTHREKFNDIVADKARRDMFALWIGTSALGMGIDIPDFRLVIQIGVPFKFNDILQMSGRAGRDGREAVYILCVSGSEVSQDGKTDEKIAQECRDFAKLAAEKVTCCIREQIISHYGETIDRSKLRAGSCCSKCTSQQTITQSGYGRSLHQLFLSYLNENTSKSNNYRASIDLQRYIHEDLLAWRHTLADTEGTANMLNIGTMTIPDDLAQQIARNIKRIWTIQDLQQLSTNPFFRKALPKILQHVLTLRAEWEAMDKERREQEAELKCLEEIAKQGPPSSVKQEPPSSYCSSPQTMLIQVPYLQHASTEISSTLMRNHQVAFQTPLPTHYINTAQMQTYSQQHQFSYHHQQPQVYLPSSSSSQYPINSSPTVQHIRHVVHQRPPVQATPAPQIHYAHLLANHSQYSFTGHSLFQK